MSDDPQQAPKASGKEVEMSGEAIWQRLRRVDELNELCCFLGEYQPVTSNNAPSSGNDHESSSATD